MFTLPVAVLSKKPASAKISELTNESLFDTDKLPTKLTTAETNQQTKGSAQVTVKPQFTDGQDVTDGTETTIINESITPDYEVQTTGETVRSNKQGSGEIEDNVKKSSIAKDQIRAPPPIISLDTGKPGLLLYPHLSIRKLFIYTLINDTYIHLM